VANRPIVPSAAEAASFHALCDAAPPNDLPIRTRRSEFLPPARSRRRARDQGIVRRRDVLRQIQEMAFFQEFLETVASAQRSRASVQNPAPCQRLSRSPPWPKNSLCTPWRRGLLCKTMRAKARRPVSYHARLSRARRLFAT